MRFSRISLFILLALAFLCLAPLGAGAEASLGGRAWIDSSGDGLCAENERWLARVKVTLMRAEGGVEREVASASTDSGGQYAFTGLAAGQYRLKAELPDEYNFILPRAGGSVLLPACGTQSQSAVFTLEDGQMLDAMHIGASKASTYIKAFAFVDANMNGGRAASEEAIKSMQTELWYYHQDEWVVIASEKTDHEGVATYWDLTPGTYRVAVTLPAPYIVGPLGQKINAWYNCVPPSDSNYGVTDPFDAPRGGSTGIGVGAVVSGALQVNLWYDNNCDGVRNKEETGFAGATLRLVNENAGVDRYALSDGEGGFVFEGLLAGAYTFSVALPEGYMFTLPGGDSLFTNGYVFKQSADVTVTAEQTQSVRPVGVMPVTTLAVRVYNDLNANGAWDAGEPAFAGAQTEVTQDGQVRAQAVSGADGTAFIPVLRGGENEIRCVLPDGQIFTVAGVSSDFVSPAATGDISVARSLPHGQGSVLNAGVTLPASLSGALFNDDNVSGVMDNGEGGLAGFAVQAVDAQGVIVAETVTGADGGYLFPALKPAPHAVRFLLTDAYVFSEYSETGAAIENKVISQTAAYGQTAPAALLPGQSVGRVDGGAFRSGTVSGAVRLRWGQGDVLGGLPGVKVTLLDAYGAPVGDTTTAYTDDQGDFYLKGALPGSYRVLYTLPEGAAFTSPMTEGETALSESFIIGTYDDLALDALYAVYTGGVSGVLYHDGNVNGALDAGESALPGVTFTLLSTEYQTEYATRTLDDGQFIFTGLRPGQYTLSVTLPDGRCFSREETSLLPASALSTGSATFDLKMGEYLENRNVAAVMPASFDADVFFDMENNGRLTQDDRPAPEIMLTLRAVNGPQAYTLLTDLNGHVSLPALIPDDYRLYVSLAADCVPADGNPAELTEGFWVSGLRFADGEHKALDYAVIRYASLSGSVWSMDASLTGVAGRAVRLFAADDLTRPLMETLTDAQGAYAFRLLKPGRYAVSCDLPEGNYRFARQNDTAARSSLIVAENVQAGAKYGMSDVFTLPMGEDRADCDIGLGALGKLGDTAWLDENGNGMQDGDEPGVPGILITLYQYGEKVASAETDAYGQYLLTDLYPGAYDVEVILHKELKTTVRQTAFPLVASILPESEDTAVTAQGVIVPSDGRNLNCDFGFVLRKKGKYPAAMADLPQTNWSFTGE